MEARLIIVLMVVGILFGFGSAAQGTTYYVATTGDDNDTGGPTDPWQHIDYAIDQVSNGDTIEVAVGTYAENVNFDGKAVTLTSTDPNDWETIEDTIIDPNDTSSGSYGVEFSGGENANSVLTGFTIRRGYYGVYCSSAGPVIEKCIIEDNNPHGIYCANSLPAIRNNIIRENTLSGIYCTACPDLNIKNNVIYDNQHGITFDNGCGLRTIENNTIVYNTSTGIRKIRGGGEAIKIGWGTDLHTSDFVSSYFNMQGPDKIRHMLDTTGTGMDFVVFTGDFNEVQSCNEGVGQTTEENLREGLEAIDDYSIPRHIVMGNHDPLLANRELPSCPGPGITYPYPNYTDKEAWIKIVQEDGPSGVFNVVDNGVQQGHYSFSVKGYHFVVLDFNYGDPDKSDEDHFRNNYPQHERDWLEADLAAHSNERTFVFTHGIHTTDWRVAGWTEVMAILEAAGNVDAVFFGHNHYNGYVKTNGIGYYRLNAMRERNADPNFYYGSSYGDPDDTSYAIIEVDPNGLLKLTGYGYEGFGSWTEKSFELGCNNTINNCILWGNGDDLSGNCKATYSCIEEGVGDPSDHNISSDPDFVDAANDDYHLNPTSPCIDIGDPSSAYSNEPEPNGGRINMGAYGNTSSATIAPDSDNDGLTNPLEAVLGTDPYDSDSDDDYMPDGWEVNNGLNPLNGSDANGDVDDDGLTNLQEYTNNTDPDDDDTDDDNMPDGWEVDNGLNPLEDDADSDLDTDTYSNIAEYIHSSDPDDPNSLSATMTIVVPTDVGTIQQAIDWSIDGDVIEVLQGTYTENVDFGGKAITLRSTDPDDWDVVAATIIDGGDLGTTVTLDSGEDANSILTGFTVRGGQSNGVDCTFASCRAVVTNCIIEKNGANGIIVNYGVSSPTITNNIIRNNDGSGICVDYGASPTIKNNVIYGNSIGIYHRGAASISNNTIVYNTNYGIWRYGQALTVSNCIIWGNIDDLYSCSATYSCIGEGIGDPNDHNISIDPNFIDAANDNYHIHPELSPCIDMGDPNGVYTCQTDIDGEARVMRGRIDMGADEVPPYRVYNTTQDEWYYYIQSAIDDASNFDEIEVNQDTYTENVDFEGKAITLRSTDPDDWDVVAATIINANGSSASVLFYNGEDSNSILTGFTLTGQEDGTRGAVSCSDGATPSISRCIFKDNDVGIRASSASPTVDNSIFFDNTKGIYSSGTTTTTIRSSLLYENTNAVWLKDNNNSTVIQNNTIVDSSSYGITKVPGATTPTPEITNCILWGNGTELHTSFNNDITYSCIKGWTGGGDGNINTDPNFVDAYHITSGSPCVDAGDPDGTYTGQVDIDGDSRTGDVIDIGADEFDCFDNGHDDYEEWIAAGKPDCWCYPRQCYGDADGKVQGGAGPGYRWVYINDLNIYAAAYGVEDPNLVGVLAPDGINYLACADFDHKKQGNVRVGSDDLDLLTVYYGVKEPPKGPGVPSDCEPGNMAP
jgi:parallel beta-helix repeat protein